MSAYSGAFGNCGYNQSGGGYYLVVSTVQGQLLNYTPGSGSGGATTVGSFAPQFTDGVAAYPSSLFVAGKVLKDMGKTIVSSGQTFRKFQAVGPQSLGTNGVVGPAPAYLTGYLEVSRDGEGVNAARIARYA